MPTGPERGSLPAGIVSHMETGFKETMNTKQHLDSGFSPTVMSCLTLHVVTAVKQSAVFPSRVPKVWFRHGSDTSPTFIM